MLFVMENWKPVAGFEDIYEVSDLGNVRSLDRVVNSDKRGTLRVRGRVLRGGRASTGYLSVALCRDGGCRSYTIHELVARAFIGPRPEGADIDHIDGNRTNNLPANLRYVSHLMNTRNITKANAKSGALGVYPNGKSGWQAQIMRDGKTVYLGTYKSIEAASAARADYEQKVDHRGFTGMVASVIATKLGY